MIFLAETCLHNRKMYRGGRDAGHIPGSQHEAKVSMSCIAMLPARLTRFTLDALDWLAAHILPIENRAEHLRTGQRGEEDAYFYLRQKGYVMIARNYRSPHHHGELDLVGWDRDVLSFIEVKTRTTRDVKTAEAAVDRDKQRDLALVARDFLRQMPQECQWRFDVLTVYYETGRRPSFELFQNAFSLS